MKISRKAQSIIDQIAITGANTQLVVEGNNASVSYCDLDGNVEISWDNEGLDFCLEFNEQSFNNARINAENGEITLEDVDGETRVLQLFSVVPKKVLVDWAD
jgi:hypothetical protein